MNKRRVWCAVSCALLLTAGSAQALVSLAVRVGCAYVGYKFVDGVTGASISQFVNQYKNGVVDGISAFGRGVQRFGEGVRSVAVDFWHDTSENSFSLAWSGVANEFGNAVSAMQSEWNVRRSILPKQIERQVVAVDDEVERDPPEVVADGGGETPKLAS